MSEAFQVATAAPAARTLIACIDPLLDSAGWDAELAACPDTSFFHGAAWARVLHGAYGFRPAYFTARLAGRLHSVLPLMEVDSWLTGRRGVALPFTDECAPVGVQSDSFPGLYQAALAHAERRGWRYLEFRGGRPLFGEAPPSSSYFGHRLDLQGGEAALLARCESSVRRAIRKAGQAGLTIEFSRELESVRDFHRLLRRTRKRHGVPPQPFSFFAGIHRHILAPGHGWVVLARQAGTPVAGAVYFRHGRTVTYKYGASDEAFQHLRANNLVMWEAIRRHAQEGFTALDFGRTSLENAGLRKFKLGWGAVEHRIDYVRYDRRTRGFAAAADRAHGWHTRLFKLLPDPILRSIGAALYKHVA